MPEQSIKEITQQLYQKLGLVWIEEETREGEVCFANSTEVRPEFRQTFTTQDLQNYLRAVNTSGVFPNDLTTFWQLVKLGEEKNQDSQD